MEVKLSSRTKLEIMFQHNPKLGVSSCVVLKGKDVVGMALVGDTCKGNKCFSKDSNRKKALSEAIKRLPVEERLKVYNTYRTMTSTPRWPEQKISKQKLEMLKLRDEHRNSNKPVKKSVKVKLAKAANDMRKAVVSKVSKSSKPQPPKKKVVAIDKKKSTLRVV